MKNLNETKMSQLFWRQVLQNTCAIFRTRCTCKRVSKVHVYKGTEKSIRVKEKTVSMLENSSIDSAFFVFSSVCYIFLGFCYKMFIVCYKFPG